MGDHSSPPFAPGSMNTPSAVGCEYMFCCGTNACERRISLPVAASSTYTKPVLPASTTAFFPATMAITGGLTASRSQIRVHGDGRPLLAPVRPRQHEHALGRRLRVHVLLRHECLRATDQLAGGKL